MNVRIPPTHNVSGCIAAPPSKAQTHRALFTALLTRGSTRIIHPLQCEDTKLTASAVKALGAKISGSSVQVVSSDGKPKSPHEIIDCGESGVTMRFLIPILSLTGKEARVKAKETLMRRPIDPLVDALEQLNVKITAENDTIVINGNTPDGGTVNIRGDVSSQFISGLLIAGTLMRKGLKLELTSPLESRNYVLLTIETLRKHGVRVNMARDLSTFEVPSGQVFSPTVHQISGDFSSASLFLSAAAVTGSQLAVSNLHPTLEPDSAFIDILSRMGVRLGVNQNNIEVKGGKLKATDVDLRECPDLGPIMAVLACYSDGITRITGARRLRYKESDRLAAMRSELLCLGADVKEMDDGLIIGGPVVLKGGTVQSHNDHRIAMALSVAALGAKGDVTIKGAECINKSYPNFFDDFRLIGVEVFGW